MDAERKAWGISAARLSKERLETGDNRGRANTLSANSKSQRPCLKIRSFNSCVRAFAVRVGIYSRQPIYYIHAISHRIPKLIKRKQLNAAKRIMWVLTVCQYTHKRGRALKQVTENSFINESALRATPQASQRIPLYAKSSCQAETETSASR
jgi:hypothetical protein